MQFIEGTHRGQTYFATLNDLVSTDNPVRLMDAFVDKLELHKPGFTNTVHKSEGRPPYAPAVLFYKLYFYGYLNKIRSSRKLQWECSRIAECLLFLKLRKMQVAPAVKRKDYNQDAELNKLNKSTTTVSSHD